MHSGKSVRRRTKLISAMEQVKEAQEYLLSAEKKWEVIDVDDDEESARLRRSDEEKAAQQ